MDIYGQKFQMSAKNMVAKPEFVIDGVSIFDPDVFDIPEHLSINAWCLRFGFLYYCRPDDKFCMDEATRLAKLAKTNKVVAVLK